MIKFYAWTREVAIARLVFLLSILLMIQIITHEYLNQKRIELSSKVVQFNFTNTGLIKSIDSWIEYQHLVEMITKQNPTLLRNEAGQIANIILIESARISLDPFLLAAIIKTESHFFPNVESHWGAIGLMQVRLPTARYLARLNRYSVLPNLDDLYTFESNIHYGALYLKYLMNKYEGDITKTLVAYNLGEYNLFKILQNGEPMPMFYANKVNRDYQSIIGQM